MDPMGGNTGEVSGQRFDIQYFNNTDPSENTKERFHQDSIAQTHNVYGIFAYIYHEFMPNVGKYAIHGASGIVGSPRYDIFDEIWMGHLYATHL